MNLKAFKGQLVKLEVLSHSTVRAFAVYACTITEKAQGIYHDINVLRTG